MSAERCAVCGERPAHVNHGMKGEPSPVSIHLFQYATSVNGEVKPEKESGEMQAKAPSLSESTVAKDSSESAAKDLVSRWLIESSAFHVGLSNGNTEPDYNDLIVRIESALTAARDSERQRCATVALEQRCERGTPWDLACLSIAAAIRGIAQPDDDLKTQNVESQVSVSALPECKAEGCNEPAKNCEYCERHHLSLCGQLHHRLTTVPDASSLQHDSETVMVWGKDADGYPILVPESGGSGSESSGSSVPDVSNQKKPYLY